MSRNFFPRVFLLDLTNHETAWTKIGVALELSVIESRRPPLEPPSGLIKAEHSLFVEIAAQADHLRPSDAPLLVSYVQATLMSRKAARDPSKADIWDRATRLQAMLATKLRLTAQSRVDPKTLGRHEPYTGPRPWEL